MAKNSSPVWVAILMLMVLSSGNLFPYAINHAWDRLIFLLTQHFNGCSDDTKCNRLFYLRGPRLQRHVPQGTLQGRALWAMGRVQGLQVLQRDLQRLEWKIAMFG